MLKIITFFNTFHKKTNNRAFDNAKTVAFYLICLPSAALCKNIAGHATQE